MANLKVESKTSLLDKGVNAWLMLNQTPLPPIPSVVYKSVDLLSFGWCHTVTTNAGTTPPSLPGGDPSYTISVGTQLTNMQNYVKDARNSNPDITLLVMLFYGDTELSILFSGPNSDAVVEQYAKNVLQFLKANQLDGFDVDWEQGLESNTTPEQFQKVFTAIHTVFDNEQKQSGKHYYLMLTPSGSSNLDVPTINSCFDWVTLQTYWGAFPSVFPGVNMDLFQVGVQFEEGNGTWFTAQSAYQAYVAGPYTPTSLPYNLVTNWRLNSGNYQYEQAQQMILHQLVHGMPDLNFDDTPIITVAGNPLITQLVIRTGNVLDAIQVTNSATSVENNGSYTLLQHGGDGGSMTTINIADNDTITQVSGFTGTWYGWNVVLQITIKTAQGVTYGPYGTMDGSTSKEAFQFEAPAGQSIVAFSGSVVQVPEAGGDESFVVQALNVSCA